MNIQKSYNHHWHSSEIFHATICREQPMCTQKPSVSMLSKILYHRIWGGLKIINCYFVLLFLCTSLFMIDYYIPWEFSELILKGFVCWLQRRRHAKEAWGLDEWQPLQLQRLVRVQVQGLCHIFTFLKLSSWLSYLLYLVLPSAARNWKSLLRFVVTMVPLGLGLLVLDGVGVPLPSWRRISSHNLSSTWRLVTFSLTTGFTIICPPNKHGSRVYVSGTIFPIKNWQRGDQQKWSWPIHFCIQAIQWCRHPRILSVLLSTSHLKLLLPESNAFFLVSC